MSECDGPLSDVILFWIEQDLLQFSRGLQLGGAWLRRGADQQGLCDNGGALRHGTRVRQQGTSVSI